MHIHLLDTARLYRQMLAEPDAELRAALFREELIAPFAGLAQIFGGGDPVAMFRQWGLDAAHSAPPGTPGALPVADWLAALEEADAFTRTAQALERAQTAFAPFADRIPTETLTCALVLADLSGSPLTRGYSGFGAMPGYILVTYGQPDAYNLPRLEGATVHEFNHNVRSTQESMIATLGNYIVGEGLAESFAAELYGEDVLGYYVTDFDQSRFEDARRIIGDALAETDFNAQRGYIFGDAVARAYGFPAPGVPDFAGYAIGYHVVQAYLARTGQSVAEATFVPSATILAESGFFA